MNIVCDNCECPTHIKQDCKYPKRIAYCCYCIERIAITVRFYQRHWERLATGKEYPWGRASDCCEYSTRLPGVSALEEKALTCKMYFCEYSPLRANDRKYYKSDEPRVACRALVMPVDHFN